MKTKALLMCLSASIFLPACGAGSPEAYVEKSMKFACQYTEKCEPEQWEEAGFESVKDCRDQLLDTDLGGEGTLRDQFVESCTDYDRGAARKCLAAAREAKGDCDLDLEEADEPACEEVCGPVDMAGLVLGNPLDGGLVSRALLELEANGELDGAPAGELTVED